MRSEIFLGWNIDSSNPLWSSVFSLEEVEENWEWPYVNCSDVEREIQSGFLSYVKVGFFLDKMRYYKLYKQRGFKSFKEYCLKALRKSAHYCSKIISAASVCVNLAAEGFKQLPDCVAQALPLVKFNTFDQGGNSPLGEKWQKVLDETPPSQPISSTQITEILDERPPETKPKQIKLKAETYAKLEKIAKAKGITVREVIDEMADVWVAEIEETPVPTTVEQEQAWEKDLEALVTEQVQVNWEISDSNGTSFHTSYINPKTIQFDLKHSPPLAGVNTDYG